MDGGGWEGVGGAGRVGEERFGVFRDQDVKGSWGCEMDSIQYPGIFGIVLFNVSWRGHTSMATGRADARLFS